MAPVIAIIGSAKHFNDWTVEYCQELGKDLARLGFEVVTGGEEGGPPSTVVKAIYEKNPNVKITFIKPENARDDYVGNDKWSQEEHCKTPGKTLFMGKNDKERQKHLAEYGDIFIMIEGGPGAKFEAECALILDKPVLPLKESSPFAAEIHKEIQSIVTKENLYNVLLKLLID